MIFFSIRVRIDLVDLVKQVLNLWVSSRTITADRVEFEWGPLSSFLNTDMVAVHKNHVFVLDLYFLVISHPRNRF